MVGGALYLRVYIVQIYIPLTKTTTTLLRPHNDLLASTHSHPEIIIYRLGKLTDTTKIVQSATQIQNIFMITLLNSTHPSNYKINMMCFKRKHKVAFTKNNARTSICIKIKYY